MKLITLRLENFQGIRSQEFTFDGRSANIYGDNATGKTTIYNAVTWLLFDKASTGAKNFSPKTKDKDGQDVHYLNHAVTADFQLDTGVTMTLSKALLENWKKKRVSMTEEFSGNTTEYLIDGVPVSEGDYNAAIGEIVSPDKAKILTMTSFFPEELPWQSRRKILLEVCGDITDEDVINSRPALAPLFGFLEKRGGAGQQYTVEEYQKIAASRKAELNRKIDAIPHRIDEAQKAIPDLSGHSLEQVEKAMRDAERKKADLERQKAEITDDTATRELREKRSELQVRLNTAKAEHLKAANAAGETTGDALRQLRAQFGALQSERDRLAREASDTATSVAAATKSREKLSTQYAAENTTEWQGDTSCYACGQPLPVEQVQKAKEAWRKAKTETLNGIRRKVEETCSKVIIADLERKLTAFKDELSAVEAKLSDLDRQIKKVKSEVPVSVPFESTPEYDILRAEMVRIERLILSGTNTTTEAQRALQDKIDGVTANLQSQADIKAKFALSDAQTARISELKEQEEALGREYEEIQHGIYLCEEFIRAKVALLTDSINEKFDGVSFRLFVQQINGGIKEDCEVLVPGDGGLVPYSTANNAARINAGIEIINVLSKHWGVQMPLFIDNRESVVRLAESETQIISLIVSEMHPALWVELL
jgi:chromosome segregation ATPase